MIWPGTIQTSSVGIVNRLGGSRWNGRSIPGGGTDSCLLQNVQNSSGTHPACYSVGTGDLSPAKMRPGREADHSLPSGAGVRMRVVWPNPRFALFPFC